MFRLGILEISTLSHIVIARLTFLVKVSDDLRVSSFLLDSLRKAKTFQNFSVFLFSKLFSFLFFDPFSPGKVEKQDL